MARKKPTVPAATAPPKGLAEILADQKPGADSERLLNDLIEVWGGTRRLALDLHAEFQHAAPGGMTRQRILEMIQRLIVINTTHDIGRAPLPSDLTMEELQGRALELLVRANAHAPAARGEEAEGPAVGPRPGLDAEVDPRPL